jgi:branched-chain amino acid transport system ATP-binding protein
MLDEPSLGIAPRVVDAIFLILDRLRQAGVAILLVEQELVRTVQLADRTYLMRTGKIIRTGTRDTIGTTEDVLSEYFGFGSIE